MSPTTCGIFAAKYSSSLVRVIRRNATTMRVLVVTTAVVVVIVVVNLASHRTHATATAANFFK
ncbi:hypothetical protein E2C01_089048 [Portunus trituberculatus]|uniref:Uncharacterized protein n=1 Tax=Portunus trituberculatus TaxID=210409 RepID=A0A5B7JCH1_PORTR|nr:hypothetical protein [Portunus trituberculatus]